MSGPDEAPRQVLDNERREITTRPDRYPTAHLGDHHVQRASPQAKNCRRSEREEPPK
jgi:hypothetical protein